MQSIGTDTYRISANSFCGNYSFLNLEIVEIQIVAANFNFLPNKLNFCCGNYMRKYGDLFFSVLVQ